MQSLLDALQASSGAAALLGMAYALLANPHLGLGSHVLGVMHHTRADVAALHSGLVQEQALWTAEFTDSPAIEGDVVACVVAAAQAQHPVDYAAALRSASHRSLRVPLAAMTAPSPAAAGRAASYAHAARSLARDATEHQAMRDVERDCVTVNGRLLIGSQVGFEAVVAAIVAAAQETEELVLGTGGDGGWASDALLRQRARAVAIELLKLGNRTVSGGDGYEAAIQVLTPSESSAVGQRAAAAAAALLLRRRREAGGRGEGLHCAGDATDAAFEGGAGTDDSGRRAGGGGDDGDDGRSTGERQLGTGYPLQQSDGQQRDEGAAATAEAEDGWGLDDFDVNDDDSDVDDDDYAAQRYAAPDPTVTPAPAANATPRAPAANVTPRAPASARTDSTTSNDCEAHDEEEAGPPIRWRGRDAAPLAMLVADPKASPPIEYTISVGPFQLRSLIASDAPPPPRAPHAHFLPPARISCDAEGRAVVGPGAPPPLEVLGALGLSDGDLDLLRSAARWRVGMRCVIRATTVYRIVDPANPDGSGGAGAGGGAFGRVSATYVRHVAWELAPSPQQAEEQVAAEQARHALCLSGALERCISAPFHEPAGRDAWLCEPDDGTLWRGLDGMLLGRPPSGAAEEQAVAHPPISCLPPPQLHACAGGGHIELVVEPAEWGGLG